jgi:NAD(P)-dependent dehydrogenase (short-subunit alcohol dehydrogenase family)
MDTNVKSAFFAVKYAMKAMKEKGIKGSIVVNSSAMSATAKRGFAGAGLYSASKAAVDMLVKYAAIEGAEAGLGLPRELCADALQRLWLYTCELLRARTLASCQL